MARKTDAPAADAPPDFGQLAAQASAPADRAETGNAMDELAAELSRPAVEVPPDAFRVGVGDELSDRPAIAPGSPRKRHRRAPGEPPGKPGRPPRTDGGRTRAGEPRQTKAEMLLELEQLRAQLSAQDARSDPDKIAELAASFRMLSHVGFALIAEARGPHWRLKEAEEKTLGDSLATAAAPHAEAIERQLPWAAPVLALVGIVGTRVIEDVRISRLNAAPADLAGPSSGPA